MGNCQAIDNASLVVQHPCGRVDRLYCPVPASQIMKLNPGHYVALLLTTTTTTTTAAAGTTGGEKNKNNNYNKVRITRIKLLRPTDTLALGHAYRLITTQEVMKGLWAKKYAKMKNKQPELADKIQEKTSSDFGSELETKNQGSKKERNHRRTASSSTAANSASAKPRGGNWHPSLHSISEAAGS